MPTSFLTCIRDIPEHRIAGMVSYPLDEMLLATLVGVLCGADDFDDVESIGSELEGWLRRFLPFASGIATAQTFRRFFRLVDAKALERAFASWVASLQEVIKGVVAIDGKTLRASKDAGAASKALHMVSAYACEAGLVIGQRPVHSKSNEITAIPELLDMLALKGTIVTIDAMGTQSLIAAKIVGGDADYVLALKGNQGSLHDDVRQFFGDPVLSAGGARHGETGIGHGRIEERACHATGDIGWLAERHPQWTKLRSIAAITAARTDKKTGRHTCETRYYIASLEADPAAILKAVRSHWAIENNLHWQLDVSFGEDHSRLRKDHAALNFAVFRRFALNMLKREPTKAPIKRKRLKALMNETFRAKILAC